MREVVLALMLAMPPAAADELVRLPVRGEAVQPYYLHDGGAAKPAYALVLFPGGDGRVDYREQGGRIVHRGRNFLVRSGDLFAGEGFVAAVLDVASDHASGMDDGFRTGAEHTQDVAAVIDDLRRRFPGVKVILVGTSRGTLSAAYAGRALGRKIDGVVLTSSVFRATRNSMGLAGFAYGDIAAPILFVQHAEDGCASCCRYSETLWIRDSYPLITVKGGDAGSGNPCEAISHHGYLGQEAEVAAAIRSWIAGKPYPKLIE
jgi:hypothetical protein